MIEVKQARNFSYTKKSMMNDTIRLAFVCLLVGGEASAQQKKTKPYTEGQTYAVGDVVALPEGNAIVVEIVKPKGPAGEGGSLSLKIKISGPLQVIAFTFGQDKSTITLGGGEKIVAATAASFAMNEVAATPSGPQLVSRMRTGADTGILVLDTNEHPLVVEFPIGPESTRGSMQLELKEFTIGRQKYSLKYTLPRANAVKPSPDDSGAGPQKVGEHHVLSASTAPKPLDSLRGEWGLSWFVTGGGVASFRSCGSIKWYAARQRG